MRRGPVDERPIWGLGLAVLVAGAVLAASAPPALAESTSATLFVPIVLSSGGAGTSFYTSELTLTNRGTTAATVELRYTAAFGGGDGTCVETLLSGEQKVIPDAIAYLRGRGVPIAEGAGRGGTLQAIFTGLSSSDAAAATVRTTTATASPQPLGAAGLSYPGIPPANSSNTSATLYGLRTSADDRSNVAVYNPATESVTVRITAFAGDGTGLSVVKADSVEIPGLGWTQLSGILDGTGITNGWVTVEKSGGSGSFGAYGVINDNRTNDGSFVSPVGGTLEGASLTVPALVETTTGFTSELVLTNRAAVTAVLTMSYVESLAPSLGTGGTFTFDLAPVTQLVIPDAIDYLRGKGVKIGARGAASFAGTLRVSVAGTTLSNVFAGARTAARCPAGGQFGLFTPGIYSGQEASVESYIYGLRADALNRTNVALVNAGADGGGAVTLEIQAFDGEAGGLARGDPETIALEPGAWHQYSGFLRSKGMGNGWVRVRRLAGSAPWIAYGVVNDGGAPGERTGDGAYVQMVADSHSPPGPTTLEILVVAGGAGGGSAGDWAGGGGGGGGGVVHLVGGSWPDAAMSVSIGGGGDSNAGGSDSSVSGGGYSLTAKGGGTGGRDLSNNAYGRDGGSGGGGGTDSQGRQTGGSGTQPGTVQTYPSGTLTQYGNSGGRGSYDPEGCGGGGGAGGAGADGRRDPGGIGYGGSGGDGVPIETSGVKTYYGAGGGGSGPGKYNSGFGGPGGAGGGGAGSQDTAANPGTGWGAGGGGAGTSQTGGSGFQGIVIIRYPGEQQATGGAVTSSRGFTVHTFTGAGVFLWGL